MAWNGPVLGSAKWFVFIMSIGFGLVIFMIAKARSGSTLLGFFLALLISIAYPIAGALLTPVCGMLRKTAFPRSDPWDEENRTLVGAFWPFVLLFWSIMALYFGIINEFYR